MTSKTPKFDKAINDYFAGLKLDEQGGQWRICRFSGEKFYVRPEDIGFYKKLKVPLPTIKTKERWRRRASYQNSYNLFWVKSAFSGKQVLAAYPPGTPHKIFEHQVWFSNEWDPFGYGRVWDESQDFFGNFRGLQLAMPRPNLVTDSTNFNSDYSNMSTHLKNCYLTFDTLSGENLYYFQCCDGSRDCVDCDSLWNCDNCYRSQALYDSFRCLFCEQSKNCLENFFLFDCRNCSHCFMSSGLRNKKFYFRNQSYSPEEYYEKLKSINLGDFRKLEDLLQEYGKLKEDAHYKPDHNFRSVNCYGDWLENSRNCYFSGFLYNSDNVNYSLGCFGYKDSYDLFGGGGGELCYELSTVSTANNYRVFFSSQIDNSRNMEYCDLCKNCHDCFGCIGLDNKSFCVLNKQYTEDDYWNIVDDIKTGMLKNGLYGEFFPPELMTVPYKLSFANSYPGFSDYENAGKCGYDVSETPVPESETKGEIITSSELPNRIKDVKDDILDKIIFDEKNQKPFRVMKYELDFYRRHNIALTREHPTVRLKRFREVYDISMTFYERKCIKCGIKIQSAHDPATFKNVYCEQCYNSEIV
ncbi:MAG: hypothetical protein UY23_C0005G0051 [Candidatus Jorgensenbacteria bacterium GW2011_GWA1_48_11]|uniref:Caib/baif family protein n=1 Tax=Candidatus Jorgensenbacteria bacterium GW2011_GWA1_48_11 TaxID=1618660 RepID=A0A0G1X9C4_9BACT|nr:MAG: hypothetical protein UY23_C0005G0051 [Candidatus Jorgensenbacteria bacterium GW2011_GWA1_48_11]KKW12314.1 MAG: hypothetical protein UY51_C0005G0556 [Candidatus Jorgensenbacteria bacterium GW2011_GWB1_49_9]